jgi:pyruvate dehydrogenase E2 component (dihydrolipoyllysine-residue acetyltransferase)
MAFSVVMPALEMAQETGKLVAWRKKEGESVLKGEPLLEVETDKAVLEVEAPADGILAGVAVSEGAVVPVGKTIAWIVRPGEAPPAETLPAGPGNGTANEPVRPVPVVAELPSERPGGTAGRMSPKARRLAKEHGVDIGALRGSGPGGEILASDILAAASSRPTPVLVDVEIPGPVGRLMAERTTQSWTTVPHFFVVRDVDAGALLQARDGLGASVERANGLRLTYSDLLVALVARVLTKHPRLNASWSDKKIQLHEHVNIGLAVAVEDGVAAVVIHNAHTTKLADVAVQRRDSSERARAGHLRPADISGATFTISNLGMYHVDAFTAIVNSPQAAILAVGSISDRVVPVAGQPGIRPMMTLTLSCDHRVVDGARAASFLNDLVEALREPEKWLR